MTEAVTVMLVLNIQQFRFYVPFFFLVRAQQETQDLKTWGSKYDVREAGQGPHRGG